jgi:hypothetical protein
LPNISEDVCCELGLDEIFKLKNSRLSDFFTSDSEVIRYRQKVILDMLNIPELKDTLSSVHPILDDIRELQRLDSESPNAADSYLYSITEIELYVSCIDSLYNGLKPIRERVKSEAFKTLSDFIFELSESDYYKELNKKLEALASRVHEVKSVTIGVNFDRELRPESAGVISINSEKFKSSKMLDKIFERFVWKCSFISPGRIAKDAQQALLVRFGIFINLLNCIESILDGNADVLCTVANIAPMVSIWDNELVDGITHELGTVFAILFDCICCFFIIDIANALKEEQRKHKGFVVTGFYMTAKDICRSIEVCFEFC